MTRLRLPVLVLTGFVLVGCGSEPVPDQLAAPAVLPSPSASAVPDGGTPPADSEPENSQRRVVEADVANTDVGDQSDLEAAVVEQFVRDYYAAVNRAQYEGDIAGLERLSLAECNCRGTAEAIRQMLSLGTVEGAAWDLESIEVQNVLDNTASVFAVVEVADGRVVAEDGTVAAEIDNLNSRYYTHALLREGNGWVMGQILS